MRARSLLPFVAFVAAACGGAPGAPPPLTRTAFAQVACTSLSIAPASPVRVVPDGAVLLHALGGSGGATFSLDGDAHGSTLELGGGLRAGAHAGTVHVVAHDAACGLDARASIEVADAFVVRPTRVAVAKHGRVELTTQGAIGRVEYALLDAGGGATLDGAGLFTAGDAERSYRILARDTASDREARGTIRVGKLDALRPRAAVVAVPAGARARLEWRGGSGAVEDSWFDAHGALPGEQEVSVTDPVTGEKASARVVVGETIGAPPTVRGTQSSEGDLISGDVNGDGVADLIVGHSERSKIAPEAGGILAYYGQRGDTGQGSGALADPPDAIEGEHAMDHWGAVLAIADLNGDHVDDIVAGAPDADLGETDRGALAVFLGAKGGLERDHDVEISGEAAGHHFGASVVVADLDGDGAPEIIVGAPNARNSFAPSCEQGKVYVFKNAGRARGVVEARPSQTLDVRDTLSDDAETPSACALNPLGAGRAVAVLDLDGDGALDLAVGAPLASYPVAGKSHGAIVVFRGQPGGRFAEAPSYSIHLPPALRIDGAQLGATLDVVGGALVARVPKLAIKGKLGGFFVVRRGSLGLPSSTAGRVRNIDLAEEHLVAAPDGLRGLGRSATLGDVDPSPGLEYIVSAATPNAPDGVVVFSASSVALGAPTALERFMLTPNDLDGFRVAAMRGGGLATWAPWRTTHQGPFVGGIDYVAAGPGKVVDRWAEHASIDLPSFGASDRAGASVLLAALAHGRSALAIVGAPGAGSPGSQGHAAGERLRAGTVDIFETDVAKPVARAWVDRNDAQLGGGPMTTLDFDGDGTKELAVGDVGESAGGAPSVGFVDPDGCNAVDAKGKAVAIGGRGAVHIYALVGGELVERFRVVAPREAEHIGSPPRFAHNRTGFAIAAADVNGDGKDDLVVGRAGTSLDAMGAEIVLGRAADPSGRVVLTCNTGQAGPRGALALPPATPEVPVHYGAAVSRLGDLDHDGCDEVALSVTRASFPGAPPRAGVLVVFGFDATAAHCAGHTAPFLLHVVPDDHALANDAPGNAPARLDDTLDVRGAPTGAGAVLARGAGDVTDDGVPDLVFRDADLAFAGVRGPAVEVVSGALLARVCPARACPPGRTGALFADADYHVVALRNLSSEDRRIVPSSGIYRGFGAQIALGDITGDGVAELAIGWSDGPDAAPFAGEVLVYAGGLASTTQAALLGDPWLVAVGDATERSAFGSSVALSRGELLVGAPSSSRFGMGGSVGAAYRFRMGAH